MLNISCRKKILDVLTDDNLTFKDHVYCVKKANQVCNMILAKVYNF